MSNHKIIEIDKNLLYSPIPTDYDSRPAEVYSFIPQEHKQLTEELNEYSSELYYKDTHRLLDNYKFINFYDFAFVSVFKLDKKIIGFATGYKRDFYPKNSVRILNRYYQDKTSLRTSFTREVLRPTTFNCILQQLELVKRLNFDYAFISREIRAVKFFETFINKLDKESGYSWEYKKGPFLLSPNQQDDKSWQSIGVVNLCNTTDFWSHWKCKQC
jgi:hypothetical protein